MRIRNHMGFKAWATLLTSSFTLVLAGCLSSEEGDAGATATTGRGETTYLIGGTVTGLSGVGLVLRNGVDNLGIGADGNFTFLTPIGSGSTYSVSVFAQPSGPSQTCTVTNGTGTATANVTSVAVNCVTNTYSVTATVLGVAGSGLVLQNNGGNNLSADASGAFTFTVNVASGSTYNVSVLSQPLVPSQTCTVNGGSGTVGSTNVTGVVVGCVTNRYPIGGSVTGLLGTGLVLQNNSGDNLPVGADGSFAFATTIASATNYSVTVLTQPDGQTCSVSGGGGTVGAVPVSTVSVSCALNAPTVSTSPAGVKKLQFTWTANPLATHYRVFENPDGVSGYTQIGGNLATTTYDLDLSGVLLTQRVNASYIVEACYNTTCSGSDPLALSSALVQAIGYFKASNTEANDFFGAQLALSADGSTLAVGAPEENSAATGINGDQFNNSRPNAGAVYVFVRSGGLWSQQAYVKASNADSTAGIAGDAGAAFGYTLTLSADGNTLAAGAPYESSGASGVNGNQVYSCLGGPPPNCALYSGAAYVFTRSGTTWSQQAYLKPFNTVGDGVSPMNFGAVLRLSADGNRLAIGAPGEGSATTGVGGDSNYTCATAGPTNCAAFSGAVYTFTRSGTIWSQQTYIKASNTEENERFGRHLALSGDGNTLAVVAPVEDSGARGINGNQIDDCSSGTPANCATASGALYVFAFSVTWAQQAYIKASNADPSDSLGGPGSVGLTSTFANLPVTLGGVALSSDGNTLALGALGESSAATGVDGAQTDNSLAGAGAVYVFSRAGTVWSQQAYVKASNTGGNDSFGAAVGLSSDGNLLAVGAGGEDSGSTGINGNQIDNSVPEAGAVYLFTRSGTTWTQNHYLKASNTRSGYRFGRALALSSDGATLAIGSLNEASGVTGIGATQNDTSYPGAGAVYLY